MSLAGNLEQIHARVAAAAITAGRNPAEVRLVAVSKTKPAFMVEEAFSAGNAKTVAFGLIFIAHNTIGSVNDLSGIG